MPRLCQTVHRTGEPCRREAAPDSDFCEVCATRCGRDTEAARLYNLSVGSVRADEVKDHPDANSLKSELAISRMLFERRYNSLPEEEISVHAGPLLDMLRKIADLKVQSDNLDRKRGDLLDSARVTQMAESLLTVVSEVIHEFVEDEQVQGEMLSAVASQFLEIIKKDSL